MKAGMTTVALLTIVLGTGTMLADTPPVATPASAAASVAPTPQVADTPEADRAVTPEPPGTTPDPLLRPPCDAACRKRARLARFAMRAFVEIARGSMRR